MGATIAEYTLADLERLEAGRPELGKVEVLGLEAGRLRRSRRQRRLPRP